MTYRKKPDAGLTLIELLLAMALSISIGVSVYKAFSSGVEIWEWNRTARVSGDASIFIERIADDLRNSMNYTSVPFEGSGSRISFFVHNTGYLFHAPDNISSSGDEEADAICKIEYDFDPSKNRFTRRQYDHNSVDKGKGRVTVQNIDAARFIFYLQDPEKGDVMPVSAWNGVLPRAVAVEITIKDKYGKERLFTKILDIPDGI